MRQMKNRVAGFQVWADAVAFIFMGKNWAVADYHIMPKYIYVTTSEYNGGCGVWRRVFSTLYHRVSTDLKPDLYEEVT